MLNLAEHKALFFEAVFYMLGQRDSREFKNILLWLRVISSATGTGKNKAIGAIADKLDIAVPEAR